MLGTTGASGNDGNSATPGELGTVPGDRTATTATPTLAAFNLATKSRHAGLEGSAKKT